MHKSASAITEIFGLKKRCIIYIVHDYISHIYSKYRIKRNEVIPLRKMKILDIILLVLSAVIMVVKGFSDCDRPPDGFDEETE